MSEAGEALPGVVETPDWTPWGEPRRGERGVETAFHHPLILLRGWGEATTRVVSPGEVLAGEGAALEWSPMPWAQRGRRLWRAARDLGPGAVFRGGGDRLFLASDAACEQMFEGDVIGARGLDGWTQALAQRTRYFAARNIAYRHLVVPDSHVIYADEIDGAPKPSPERPLLQVLRRAGDATRASVIYPLETLIAGRAHAEISHPHDVHLTGYGYFLVYREVMKSLPGFDPARLLREDEITVRKALIAGDVARSVGAPGRRVDIYDPPVPRHTALIKGTSYKPNQVDVFETQERGLPKLLMFRTSNSSHLFGYLLRHFSRIAAVAGHDVFYDLVESERPDVVITEMPERYFAHTIVSESETDRGGPPRDPDKEFAIRTGQQLPLPVL